jgi:MFS family permease
VRVLGGYGTVWAERPVRRLLVASLGGRVAFSMLPLGVVLFATDATGSSATTGALVAAFLLASTLAPVRGRIVDRHGPAALVAFAAACAAGLLALWAAGARGAPPVLLLAVGALTGAVLPPLGPFTRAVWGASLRGRGERLQHVYALDSAGEEAALIVAPLIVAAIFAAGSSGAALAVAGLGLLAGTAAAARSELTSSLAPAREVRAKDTGSPLSLALWLVICSVLGPGAALGAINVAIPALTREAGKAAIAGLLLAALAVGTAASSLIAGRRAWRRPPMQRLAFLQLLFAAALALAAATSGRLEAVAAALVIAGGAVGALFVTVYVLVDELTPAGSGTRTFAWLAAANNAGIAAGAAASGALISGYTDAAGLWLAAGWAVAGALLAAVAGVMRR